MGGVNGVCIPRTNPNYCRENHMTPRKIKGKSAMFSATFNLDDSAAEQPMELLNINTASEEELMTLPGVNRIVARQIVQYRLQINGFKKVEDLALCSGVGAAKLSVIRSEITVGKKTPSLPETPLGSHKDFIPHSESRGKLTRTHSAGQKPLRVSVNDSNVFQLMKVPGISQQLGENIVAYRDKKGRFRALDDLVKVKGINTALLGAIRHYLLLSTVCNGNGYVNGYTRSEGYKSEYSRTPTDGKSKTSLDSASERSDRTLSGSQFDLLTHFTPLTEKHVRPIVAQFGFKRDDTPAIRLATWNVQRMCLDKAANPGVLEVMCMTILENGLSIIAFQELAHRNALHKIVAELNCPSLPNCKRWSGHRGQWKVAVSEGPVGRMFQAMEYHAFIYDTSHGVSLENLETLNKSDKKEFVRRPLLAYFKADQVDFVFVSVHLKAAGLRDEDRDEVEKEVLNVANLTAAIERHLPGERDIIVAGDFNLSPSEKEFDPLEAAGYFNAIPHTRPTNISRKNLDGSACYDNVWFSRQAQKLYTGMSGVVRCGLTHPFIPDGWTWGGLVSDHCPVWVEIITDKDYDPDGIKIDLSDIRLDDRESFL